ncbi:Protein of unknown function [Jannaschia faecimaris]|uniref:Uncharacterized protein n=1 Tax=Jannaschia faecimaris TaxID=1244108 RepID=A0A1H3K979_9RHOB|nr:DUF1376 domain-containing protein [Jannaschia faecimaris]SDY48746.1 Protein of unknown function [Jannaschia faecimaris]
MKHGSDWYKRYPNDHLGGIQGLSVKEHAVYSIVLDLIYSHGGSVNDDPGWISGWIKDLGPSATRNTINSLVARGKLDREGDQLTQKRATIEAKTKEDLSETRQGAGKKGGISSGVSRQESQKNRYLSEAYACPREEERRGGKRKGEERRGEVDDDDDGGRVHAREADQSPDFRERLLVAIGADPVSGMIGPTGKRFGTGHEMARAQKWRDNFGFTEDEIVQEIAIITEARDANGTGPPGSWAYYESALTRLKTERAIAAMDTSPDTPQGTPRANRSNSRPLADNREFHRAHAEYERRLAAGEIDRGPDPSDPWARISE